jgi:hypothetical protein
MVLAVERVRERLLRASAALEAANVPYAVVGGNAVAAWVSKVDPEGARNTVDVDLLVRRADFEIVESAMENAGFVYRHAAKVDLFLDGPEGKARDAVRILFAGERVRQDYLLPSPELHIDKEHRAFRLLNLEELVRMKLTSFRDKDRTHIRDLIDVGLVDQTWTNKLPPELAPRLQELLDTPDG